MKLSFSTLGCPGWTFEQILAAATANGFAGIEFRGLLGEIDLPNAPEFSPAEIARTRARLEEANLRACCLSSSVSIVAAQATAADGVAAVDHAKRYVHLAAQVNSPFVRLFCGGVPADMPRGTALEKAANALRQIGDFAATHQVTAVLETHDAFIRSAELRELVQLTGHPAVQVLWDIHHPYRLAGEVVAETMRNLDGHIRYTHVKDSLPSAEGEGYSYTLLGHGDIPYPEILRALRAAGYNGFLTLEWEKRWIPELADPEIAIPQYAEQMRAWLAELA